LNDHAGDIGSSINERPKPEEIKHEVTLQDYMLAALHGSTIDLGDDNEHEFFESGSHLVVLAHWIGVLKRTGQQVFGRGIARCLRVGWTEIETGQNCLLGQFPMEVWRILLQRSKGFFPPVIRKLGVLPRFDYRGFREAKPIKIQYEWITEQTLGAPPCRATNSRITVRGPMLCFPTHQMEDWKIKAAIVHRQRGFMVQTKEVETASPADR
jgi:hypothetical protein